MTDRGLIIIKSRLNILCKVKYISALKNTLCEQRLRRDVGVGKT